MTFLNEGDSILVEPDEEDMLIDHSYLWSTVKRVPGIYMLWNLATGDWYIGSSSKLRKRALEHRADLRRRRHPNKHLQNAWNKYGEDNFKFGTIELCEKQDLIVREQYWLDRLKPKYNINKSARAFTGPKTKEHREALSRALKGQCVGNAAILKAKTHCPSGHEYTEDNTYFQMTHGRRSRLCKACKLLRSHRRYERIKVSKKHGQDIPR